MPPPKMGAKQMFERLKRGTKTPSSSSTTTITTTTTTTTTTKVVKFKKSTEVHNGRKVYIMTPDSDDIVEECPKDQCTCGCPGECSDARRRHHKEKGKHGSGEKGKGWKGKE
jgi:hypothetical protein